ncbi:hypothetical protein T11_7776 [Trichinella zimbabwensis]|uniref:Uncharacterized protein n=1 Tax=Trichinella zimbabwensis TaxID=268475 RepID=A0A0V1I0M4_9BILA|nr:hypothetical protein T11_7776 [Trichinella zimbabwensis]
METDRSLFLFIYQMLKKNNKVNLHNNAISHNNMHCLFCSLPFYQSSTYVVSYNSALQHHP